MAKLLDVPGYPGYTASEDGRIYRDGIELVGSRSGGYVFVASGKRPPVKRSWLVCSAFHGPKPFPEAQCLHLNDTKDDDRPNNLAWGTHAENVKMAYDNGVLVPYDRSGSRHWNYQHGRYVKGQRRV